MKLVRIVAIALATLWRRHRSAATAEMERMERRSVRPRAGRTALRHPRSRGGVVPLVPRHGEDDLRQSRGQGIGREISAGAGRSGRQPRSVEPLWRLGLAGDHRVRPRRHRDRQDQGYIEPERMQALLKAIIDDPSPGPSVGEALR